MDEHKESIVAFHHADSAWTTKVDSVMDPSRDFGYYGDADLAEFLRRPVKILDADWTVTAGSYQTAIDPWTLFLEDARVRNRVEGYRMLQGTLNLRLAINGGPFYYGRAMAAYFPRPNTNSHSFGDTTGEVYKQQLSMLPHVFLDPTTSEGGEIVCPFLCPDNFIDLSGGTYKDMGRLHIASMNDLLHANSSTGKVNIAVYAWMTNVRLAAPTAKGYGSYEAHAGDEYGNGIVSKPASIVAKAAGHLANIPEIKPFALATQLAASTVGRVAHVFGYSRPAIVTDIQKVRHKAAGSLANTDSHEAVAKLSLDSKQELSIDPRTVGLSDVDEMAFNYIKQKECYMSTMTWTESQLGEALIGNITIGPDFHNREVINGNPLTFPCPMYTVAAPFKFWRGSIKLRFQIAASQLHRGRLRFSYDPVDATSGSPAENEVYSRIIDLATNRDFEMVISWNHPQAWLRVYDRFGSSFFNHPVGTTTINPNYHNGQVRVEVVNELTSPNPALAQPVYVNLFVSAGEDFEVAMPTDDILANCEYEPQSGGLEPHAGTEGEELIEETDNIPESPAPITPIGQQDTLTSPNSHIFFGESFASIRALLKRYCYHMTMSSPESSVGCSLVESNFPCYPGQAGASVCRHVTDATSVPPNVPYNFTGMTYLNWFTPCYVGWRGSLRSKYSFQTSNQLTVYSRRFSEPVAQSHCGIDSFFQVYVEQARAAYIGLRSMGLGAGSEITPLNTDGAVELEFPFYSNKRFAPARRMLDGSGTGGDEWQGENAGHAVLWTKQFAANDDTTIHRHVAAGDDFSLFMWIGQPGILKREKPVPEGPLPTFPPY